MEKKGEGRRSIIWGGRREEIASVDSQESNTPINKDEGSSKGKNPQRLKGEGNS